MAAADVAWRPVSAGERYQAIDFLRGFALFGVLFVNLETLFRVSLFSHILHFHGDSAPLNVATDYFLAGFWEFKAFTLFSILFGAGTAIQYERASKRGVSPSVFLLRRFLVLLVVGLCHLFLIWNGEILTLYAICGLLLIPVLRLPLPWLALATAIGLALPYIVPGPELYPESWAAHAERATHVYQTGGLGEILRFRIQETLHYIGPLLLSVLARTWGVMLLGVLAWRAFPLRSPADWRRILKVFLLFAVGIGGTATALDVYGNGTGHHLPISRWFVDLDTNIPVALAYAAAILLWHRQTSDSGIAALGQMALTNYLAQSVILSVLFYGFGFGLFGRIGSAAGLLIAIAIYVAQVFFSKWWLARYRFGPFEWLWRTLTYGTRQPMRSINSRSATA